MVPGVDCVMDEIEVSVLYEQAKTNFLTGLKHKLDGSGISIMSDLTSTFPDPSWSNSKCQSYDKSWHSSTYSPLQTRWTF